MRRAALIPLHFLPPRECEYRCLPQHTHHVKPFPKEKRQPHRLLASAAAAVAGSSPLRRAFIAGCTAIVESRACAGEPHVGTRWQQASPPAAGVRVPLPPTAPAWKRLPDMAVLGPTSPLFIVLDTEDERRTTVGRTKDKRAESRGSVLYSSREHTVKRWLCLWNFGKPRTTTPTSILNL